MPDGPSFEPLYRVKHCPLQATLKMLTLLEEVMWSPLPQTVLVNMRYSDHMKALNTWGEKWMEFSGLIILSLVNWTLGWKVSMSDSEGTKKPKDRSQTDLASQGCKALLTQEQLSLKEKRMKPADRPYLFLSRKELLGRRERVNSRLLIFQSLLKVTRHLLSWEFREYKGGPSCNHSPSSPPPTPSHEGFTWKES